MWRRRGATHAVQGHGRNHAFNIDQVLFLPTTNWLTNTSSNADVSTAGLQSSSGQNIKTAAQQLKHRHLMIHCMFVSQFVVGRKRT